MLVETQADFPEDVIDLTHLGEQRQQASNDYQRLQPQESLEEVRISVAYYNILCMICELHQTSLLVFPTILCFYSTEELEPPKMKHTKSP